MPSVVLQKPAPARVTYSSRPRKLPEQPAASPSPGSEGRATGHAEESALDNSLKAAKSGASREATPCILKRGDPIPKAFDTEKPSKQPAAQEFVPLPVGEPDAEQPEPISAAYEVGEHEKSNPSRRGEGLARERQNRTS